MWLVVSHQSFENIDFHLRMLLLKKTWHIQVRLCFTFSFKYTFQFNDQLNNALFMFWKMNIKI